MFLAPLALCKLAGEGGRGGGPEHRSATIRRCDDLAQVRGGAVARGGRGRHSLRRIAHRPQPLLVVIPRVQPLNGAQCQHCGKTDGALARLASKRCKVILNRTAHGAQPLHVEMDVLSASDLKDLSRAGQERLLSTSSCAHQPCHKPRELQGNSQEADLNLALRSRSKL